MQCILKLTEILHAELPPIFIAIVEVIVAAVAPVIVAVTLAIFIVDVPISIFVTCERSSNVELLGDGCRKDTVEMENS